MSQPLDAIATAASRLRDAQRDGCPCEPVRDVLGDDLRSGYAVQSLNNELLRKQGRRPIGWKVGLTSEAVQRQLGVDQPDFGMLFAESEVGDDLAVPAGLLQPRVEAEVAFVLNEDLTEAPASVVDVINATAYVLPAIEIVDSRISNWDISVVDTIADNASSGMYVLGASPVPLTAIDLRDVTMTMTTAGGDIVSQGGGHACLGHPVNAVVWLANTLLELESGLRAGDLVLSGALGAMRSVTGAETYTAKISGLGTVRARFVENE